MAGAAPVPARGEGEALGTSLCQGGSSMAYSCSLQNMLNNFNDETATVAFILRTCSGHESNFTSSISGRQQPRRAAPGCQEWEFWLGASELLSTASPCSHQQLCRLPWAAWLALPALLGTQWGPGCPEPGSCSMHSSDVAGQQQLGQRHSHACKTCFQNTKYVEEFPFRIKPIVREKDRGHSVIVSWSISCLGSCCTPRQSLAKVPAAPWSTAATSSCRAPGLAHDAPAKPQCSRRRLSLPGALCRKAETSGSAVPLKLQTFQLERNNGEK